MPNETSHESTSRCWSQLTVKSVDEEQRIIRGIASTPSTDRAHDIVEPKGAKFSLPLPLLNQHEHDSPIGFVERATVTDDGIEIEARIPKDTGISYVERVWAQIKAGLVRGLSIGFRPLKVEPLEKGGLRYLAWEWFELSAVTVPANADATIQTIKSIDLAKSSGEPDRDGAESRTEPSEATVSAIQSAKRAVLAAKRTIRS